MRLGYVICDRVVPVIVEPPGLGAGNVRGQPFAVAGRDELVLPAVQQQDRDSDVGRVESPRPPHVTIRSMPSSAQIARTSTAVPATVRPGWGEDWPKPGLS
jgi:hypothetical protein